MFKTILFLAAIGLGAVPAHADEAPLGAVGWLLSGRGKGNFERYTPVGAPVILEGPLREGQPFWVQSLTFAGYGVLQADVTNVRRGLLPRLSLKAGTPVYRTGTKEGLPEWCTASVRAAPVCLYTENGVWNAVRPGSAPLGGYMYWQLATAPVVTEKAYPGHIVERLLLVRNPKLGWEIRQVRDTTGPDGWTANFTSETPVDVLEQGDVTTWGGNGKGVRLHMNADGELTATGVTRP